MKIMNTDRLWFVWIFFWITIALVLAVLWISSVAQAFDGIPAQYGYPGPPMWDRGRNPEYDRERPPFPPPRRWGPQGEPCIYRGDCRGPRPDNPPYGMPRFPGPPDRYDMYED